MAVASARRGGGALVVAKACLIAALAASPPAKSQTTTPDSPPREVTLRVVGGLAGVNQYTRHEEPFWTRDLPRISGGRLRAEIVPLDRGGVRGSDMLSLMKTGVIPFGTLLVSQANSRDPELPAIDLAGLNPDMAALRRTVAAARPRLTEMLRQRYSAELLAIYTYPAQVLFCRAAFRGLGDLQGRRIRTSGASQVDWVRALGAQPVATPFAEVAAAMRNGHIDCALTGTMSGYTIGLPESATHVHAMAVNWGVSVFAASGSAWRALEPEQRSLLQRELAALETRIWADADQESTRGLDCNTGRADCAPGPRGRMTLVSASADDALRRTEVLRRQVLPGWLARCDEGCETYWNTTLRDATGLEARAP
jgi:TRAP-type C4-dicarboxylate transport system substrate-binding protein